jgi:hypothetical protein
MSILFRVSSSYFLNIFFVNIKLPLLRPLLTSSSNRNPNTIFAASVSNYLSLHQIFIMKNVFFRFFYMTGRYGEMITELQSGEATRTPDASHVSQGLFPTLHPPLSHHMSTRLSTANLCGQHLCTPPKHISLLPPPRFCLFNYRSPPHRINNIPYGNTFFKRFRVKLYPPFTEPI